MGAGPAGGDLATQLARAGQRVLLIDQLVDLRQAAFSSAAMPLEAMQRFGLPAELVGHRWRTWQVLGPGRSSRYWRGERPLGVVLDFGALRCWQTEQTRRWGGEVALGLRAQRCRFQGNEMFTDIRQRDGSNLRLRSRWVVDATGQARGLIGDPTPKSRRGQRDHRLIRAVGVEWLLQVPIQIWDHWAEQLSFCLGSDWVPQGYGWVFPMEPGLLKLGACRITPEGSPQVPLAPLMQDLYRRLFPGPAPASSDPDEGIRVLDRHGGLVRSSIARREPHQRGRLIALGDAVSTANLLGGEGIRHALTASRVLAPLLLDTLDLERRDLPSRALDGPLRRYPRLLRQALGWRWVPSGRIARRTWLSLAGSRGDRRLDSVLRGLEQRASAEDLSALLFDYRFERFGPKLVPYLFGWR
ncbi:MAG: NAD(P)/FAD-dependent oxidoreductase [Synechococcaceae cyanobacterium]|nr:NAD(P)/FAD-dependent oxidoreductase [Synechococcaceae cyanobacterium]